MCFVVNRWSFALYSVLRITERAEYVAIAPSFGKIILLLIVTYCHLIHATRFIISAFILWKRSEILFNITVDKDVDIWYIVFYVSGTNWQNSSHNCMSKALKIQSIMSLSKALKNQSIMSMSKARNSIHNFMSRRVTDKNQSIILYVM